MSVPNVGRWLDILGATGQILVAPPYFETLGKRLIKAPKIYVADSGVACYLLGIETAVELERSPFLGSLFEGLMASEIAKHQLNSVRRREPYYFRDQQGLNVDFMVPSKGRIQLIEAKATHTPKPEMATPMRTLASAWAKHGSNPTRDLELYLVHRPSKSPTRSTALAPGAKAVPWREFLSLL